ncbi:MAG: hypothetical protein VB075_14085 [Petrimonas sp.]|uniref:hypothetical protein n=1 Tax=Petrimonas sp. TaxID=2023866 RepID=UPI002B3D1F53|nr:hypothetical protein [Petrimonas sp.]
MASSLYLKTNARVIREDYYLRLQLHEERNEILISVNDSIEKSNLESLDDMVFPVLLSSQGFYYSYYGGRDADFGR